ncbi:MAG: hypothetical protein GF344_18755, partial [Chitinivibrionales bacterium]|nr:hypothetical protein [Chitinivibrionales bacterium]
YRAGALPAAQFVFVVLLFSYAVSLFAGRFRPRMNYLLKLFVPLVLWLVLVSVLSPFRYAAKEHLIEILKYLLPLMLISSGLRDRRSVYIVVLALTLSVGIWSSQGGVKGLTSGVTSDMRIKGGQMSDNNDFMAGATAIVPMLVLFAFTYKGKAGKIVRLFFAAMLFLTLAAIVFSNSRGAAIGLIGLMIFYLAMVSKKRIRDFLVIVFVIFIGYQFLPETFFDRMSTIEFSLEEQTEESAAGRLMLMKAAARAALDYPLKGVGPDCWLYIVKDYVDTAHEPHNAYLKLAAETGFPGLLLYLIICIGTIYRMLLLSAQTRLRGWTADANLCMAMGCTIMGMMLPLTFLNHPFSEFLWAWLAVANAYHVIISEERADVAEEQSAMEEQSATEEPTVTKG